MVERTQRKHKSDIYGVISIVTRQNRYKKKVLPSFRSFEFRAILVSSYESEMKASDRAVTSQPTGDI
jgi:hypothetical protein